MTLPPTFGGPLREVVPDDVVLPRLFLAFRSPVFGSDEYYAASVCGAILGLKKGSRLHRRLVREQQIAAEAQAFTYDLAKGSDLLVRRRHGAARRRRSSSSSAAVHAEVDRLRDEGVTADEVARAVALIETELIVGAAVGRRSRGQALDVRDVLRRPVARERAGGALPRGDGGRGQRVRRASGSAQTTARACSTCRATADVELGERSELAEAEAP